jgi:hypothetical protein
MSRGQAVALLLLIVVAVWALMLVGWRRRAGRSAGLDVLPAVPADPGPPLTEPAEGVYVSTTTAGDWLDRVTAQGLGTRSAADMVVTGAGVGWMRQGAPQVWAPRAALVGVRRASGMAGKFVERDGLVVVTWRLGEQELDTGFRPRRGQDAGRLARAVGQLVPGGAATGPDGTPDTGGAP